MGNNQMTYEARTQREQFLQELPSNLRPYFERVCALYDEIIDQGGTVEEIRAALGLTMPERDPGDTLSLGVLPAHPGDGVRRGGE